MKAYRLLIILLVVITALPFTGRLFWIMKKNRPIDIFIINKSVEKSSQNEVKALNWTLNFEKFVKPEGDAFNYEYDYWGNYPDAITDDRKIKSFKLEEISEITEKYDALFFIDTQGVKSTSSGKKGTKAKVYNGFNQNDYFLLKEMLSKQKLVVAEFNFISEPTEDLVRYNTEQFLDVYSLGWIGRYFENLSKEQLFDWLPPKWFDIYKQNYSSDWEFKGPGLILMNSGQNRILVLPAEKYMKSKYPVVITTPEMSKEYSIPLEASYKGWFELSYEGKNKVISHFNLNLTDEGIAFIRKNGLEPEFPAVIESGNKKFYYIAGDFSKGKYWIPLSRLGFISKLFVTINDGKTKDPDRFFQVYYNHLFTQILTDYYSEISGPGEK